MSLRLDSVAWSIPTQWQIKVVIDTNFSVWMLKRVYLIVILPN